MTAIAGNHTRHGEPHDVQNGLQVDFHLKVDVCGGGIQNRAFGRYAGVIHDNVELHVLRQLGDGRQIAHVDRVRDATGSLRQLIQTFRVASERMHFESFTAEALDDRSAHSGRSARHQRGLVV